VPRDLHGVVRVRELRARLAEIEVVRLRQALHRADVELMTAAQAKANHETNIERAFDAWAAFTLDFITGERMRIRDAEVKMRRTRLARQRVQEDMDTASQAYRDLLLRRATLTNALNRQQRLLRLKRIEREDQTIAEDRAALVSYRRDE
jgi:hypothetical protein